MLAGPLTTRSLCLSLYLTHTSVPSHPRLLTPLSPFSPQSVHLSPQFAPALPLDTVVPPLNFIADMMARMEAAIQGLSMQVHSIEELFPTVVVGFVVNPSDATNEPKKAVSLLECLNLDESARLNNGIYSLPDDVEWPDFKFEWPKQKPDELASYDSTLQYIASLGLKRHAYTVGSGNNLYDGFLFDLPIYSLRRRRLQHGGVVQKHRLRGRTDLVLFHEGGLPLPLPLKPENGPVPHILRHQVGVCIEIKTSRDISKSKTRCEMEAMLEVVGMNADNQYSSPVVLLTDLNKDHSVFVLERSSSEDGADSYHISRTKCDSFAAALHLSIQPRLAISEDFSRPNTPEQDDISITNTVDIATEDDVENEHDP